VTTTTSDFAFVDSLPVAAFATDRAGRVVRCNTAAAALWGREPDPTAPWSGAVRLYDAQGRMLDRGTLPAARALAEGRAPEEFDVLFAERPDGSRVAFVPRPGVLRAADGTVLGVVELMLEPSTPDPADLSAARLAAIVSSSDDAIVGKTLEGRVTSWNDAAARTFGWSAEEMIGQSITRIIPPELLSEEDDILARLRRGERVAHFETERIAKDGRRFAVSVTVSPIFGASGRVVGASKIARDVSGRKRAEGTQRRLVEELNHRVKNTLATIQAITAQSLRRSPSPEAFVQSFGGRVQALARAHDLLIAAEMAGADLAAIIAGELAACGTAGDVRVTLDGPAVMLEPRVTVQMTLVVHELLENARRHGSLARPAGRIEVRWHIAAGPQGRRLLFDWHERGGAPAPAMVSTGFGLALIERGLAASEGSARRRATDDGLTWEISLSLPEMPAALPPAAPVGSHQLAGPTPVSAIEGCRVLVVEDEPLVALEMATQLAEVGAMVVGPAGTLEAAARLIEAEPLDAALLDAHLGGKPVDALAKALDARGVPFAFASGYGRSELPEGFRDRPLLNKPFVSETLIGLVAALLVPADTTVVPLGRWNR
jgi:PAS domain S-box-containing protein